MPLTSTSLDSLAGGRNGALFLVHRHAGSRLMICRRRASGANIKRAGTGARAWDEAEEVRGASLRSFLADTETRPDCAASNVSVPQLSAVCRRHQRCPPKCPGEPSQNRHEGIETSLKECHSGRRSIRVCWKRLQEWNLLEQSERLAQREGFARLRGRFGGTSSC
jgi:hypothetical protein